jgi:tetratricopeptide (TPR) repeat protein
MENMITKTKLESESFRKFHLKAMLAIQNNQLKQADECLNLVNVINYKDKLFFYRTLGQGLYQTRHGNSAKKHFDTVLSINPNDALTHYFYSLIFESQGNLNKTREHLQEFLNIWKDADEGLPEKIDAHKRMTKLIVE